MDSISLVLMRLRSPSKGMPSTTYKGSLSEEMEPTPRILMEGEPPRFPEAFVTWTPATLPARAWAALEIWTLERSSDFIVPAEPVKASRFILPKATTTTSSSISVFS